MGGSNYLVWASSVELWCKGQGVQDHLIKQSSEGDEKAITLWAKIDAQLCSILWRSIDSKLMPLFCPLQTCYLVWAKARTLYANDISRFYDVISRMTNLKKQELDMSTYLGQVQAVMEEFETLMPVSASVAKQQEQRQKMFLVLTLAGLPNDLDSVAQTETTGNQSFSVSKEEYNELLQYRASKHTSPQVASVAQTDTPVAGNSFACVSQSSTLGPWVMDSGASDHISDNKTLLSNIVYSQSLPAVTLVNGCQTKAQGVGQANPLSSITLDSILYVPGCPFSLASDRSTGQTIGTGRESEGLYYLNSLSPSTTCRVTDPPDLIHCRLGHPSLSKLQKMVPSLSSLSTLDCESCQLGKHTRASFPRSVESHAESVFSLVHFDIWGPSRVSSILGFRYFDAFKEFPIVPPPPSNIEVSPILTIEESSVVPPCFPVTGTPLLTYHRCSCPTSGPTGSRPAPDPAPSTPIALRKGEALSHPGWRQAMSDEMSALHTSGTWELVPLPSGKSTVGCRWVYAVKVGPDGQIDRLKAHLVAKEYTQIFGLDYSDTFSPVAKVASVRLFLSMVAVRHWPLYQLDIKNVFLHGDLEDEVYMEQPPGFVAQGESCGLVCRLRRSLYGLKQSPRAWFDKFNTVIQEFGMTRSEADHSVFYRHSASSLCIYLVVYVDDIVIIGNDQDDITNLKKHLFQHFQTKDLGRLKYFLGIEVA
ncbi:uncharacterized protein [Nicotiana sylvestris]|uniref:uncharacterized protein n=1 Tax=Nicotiana sylvestris TaxID=4096 RepID=UPI00388CBFB0